MENLKKTPLYDEHKKLGARLGEFAGWEMPFLYEGLQKEALAVRNGAGIFDISHMGKILVSGPDAQTFLQRMITGNILKLENRGVLYTFLCKDNGGIIDDLMVYRLGPKMFLLVVNSANTKKALNHLVFLQNNLQVEVMDKTWVLAMVALQGPLAETCLKKLAGIAATLLPRKRATFDTPMWHGITLIVSRTGYTGEDGFEIISASKYIAHLWRNLTEIGKNILTPCGLGARDILRLEAGLPLYGRELSEDINPIEAGLERFASFRKKSNFIGKLALRHQKKQGPRKKLAGFEILSGRIARQGYHILKEGKIIGWVTSGGLSPTLQKSIGMGFVAAEFAKTEEIVEINIRGQAHQAKITALPFYRKKQ